MRDAEQPPLSLSAVGAMHFCSLQTKPPAQSLELLQVLRHAPNAGSHAYGPQSKGIALSLGHAAPGAVHTAGPRPVLELVHVLRAQSEPAVLPMHVPEGPHVPLQVSCAPHSPRRSTPTGSGVHTPGALGRTHE